MRTLWLLFERPPHSDAVSFPANEADVRLVVELLRRPYEGRCDLALHLRNHLTVEVSRSPFDRRLVPVRNGEHGFRLVPWRLAKWLACVLPAANDVVEHTRRRLENWLAERRDEIAVVAQPAR